MVKLVLRVVVLLAVISMNEDYAQADGKSLDDQSSEINWEPSCYYYYCDYYGFCGYHYYCRMV